MKCLKTHLNVCRLSTERGRWIRSLCQDCGFIWRLFLQLVHTIALSSGNRCTRVKRQQLWSLLVWHNGILPWYCTSLFVLADQGHFQWIICQCNQTLYYNFQYPLFWVPNWHIILYSNNLDSWVVLLWWNLSTISFDNRKKAKYIIINQSALSGN